MLTEMLTDIQASLILSEVAGGGSFCAHDDAPQRSRDAIETLEAGPDTRARVADAWYERGGCCSAPRCQDAWLNNMTGWLSYEELLHMADDGIARGARLSSDFDYRYTLWRRWDDQAPPVIWVMLNPSTADGETDDPTIRKVMGFSRAWGAGGCVVVNLFAYRATMPENLYDQARRRDVVGPDNDATINLVCAAPAMGIVMAWGASASGREGRDLLQRRAHHVRQILSEHAQGKDAKPLWHLGLTASGHPRHPLYLSNSTKRCMAA